VAALLSLLIHRHGQKGIVVLTSVELIHVVLKDVKNQKSQKWERKKLQAGEETFKLLFYSGSEVQRRHFCGTSKSRGVVGHQG